jgi:hypothetical protein
MVVGQRVRLGGNTQQRRIIITNSPYLIWPLLVFSTNKNWPMRLDFNLYCLVLSKAISTEAPAPG